MHVAPTVAAARHSGGPTAVRREIWADIAKGVCILLVVLWHVVQKHYLDITWRISLPIPGAWGTLGEQLLPLRMPLFFTISGLFAVTAVNRPWSVVGRSKVARFYYLFVLWVLIHTAALALTPAFDTARARDGLELLEQLTVTPPNLWYLYALALYFVIAKVTRRAPRAVVLGAAFALSTAAAAGLLATPGNRGGLYQNLFFFLAGLHLRPFLERLVRAANWWRVAVTGAAYAVALLAMAATDSQEWPLVWPLVSIVAVLFGMTAAGQVSRWRALGGGLAALGRRTLPIYVIHMPVLALLDWLLLGPMSTADVRWQWVSAVIEPAVLTAVAVAICLVLHAGLRRAGLTWFFDLPSRRTGHVRRGRHAAGRPSQPPPADPILDGPTIPLPLVPHLSRPNMSTLDDVLNWERRGHLGTR
ncbi:MAG TPA: acyltransferase family protein [Pilimelia sp.]|nr:acyltransferase family protein [Pilimelia sp.]